MASVLALSAISVYGSAYCWLILLLSVFAVALAFTGSYLKLRWRTQQKRAAKSVRASVLKHVWEENHGREW